MRRGDGADGSESLADQTTERDRPQQAAPSE